MVNFSQLWSSLEDWAQLVENFKGIASQLKTTYLVPHSNETHITLLRWLVHFNDQRSASKVMSNLLGVAMHLARLRDYGAAICDGDETNILIGSAVDISSAASSILTKKEFDYAQKFHLDEINPEDGRKDVAPLMLALFVSPIYLLIPSLLLKKSFAKHTLLCVSSLTQRLALLMTLFHLQGF